MLMEKPKKENNEDLRGSGPNIFQKLMNKYFRMVIPWAGRGEKDNWEKYHKTQPSGVHW
jgi:hypothetical protein